MQILFELILILIFVLPILDLAVGYSQINYLWVNICCFILFHCTYYSQWCPMNPLWCSIQHSPVHLPINWSWILLICKIFSLIRLYSSGPTVLKKLLSPAEINFSFLSAGQVSRDLQTIIGTTDRPSSREIEHYDTYLSLLLSRRSAPEIVNTEFLSSEIVISYQGSKINGFLPSLFFTKNITEGYFSARGQGRKPEPESRKIIPR